MSNALMNTFTLNNGVVDENGNPIDKYMSARQALLGNNPQQDLQALNDLPYVEKFETLRTMRDTGNNFANSREIAQKRSYEESKERAFARMNARNRASQVRNQFLQEQHPNEVPDLKLSNEERANLFRQGKKDIEIESDIQNLPIESIRLKWGDDIGNYAQQLQNQKWKLLEQSTLAPTKEFNKVYNEGLFNRTKNTTKEIAGGIGQGLSNTLTLAEQGLTLTDDDTSETEKQNILGYINEDANARSKSIDAFIGSNKQANTLKNQNAEEIIELAKQVNRISNAEASNLYDAMTPLSGIDITTGVGEQVPNIVLALSTGGIGSGIAGGTAKVAAQSGVKKQIAKELIANGVSRETAIASSNQLVKNFAKLSVKEQEALLAGVTKQLTERTSSSAVERITAEILAKQLPKLGVKSGKAELAGSMIASGTTFGSMDYLSTATEAREAFTEWYNGLDLESKKDFLNNSDFAKKLKEENPNITYQEIYDQALHHIGVSAGVKSGLFTGITSALAQPFLQATFGKTFPALGIGKSGTRLAQLFEPVVEGIEESSQEAVNIFAPMQEMEKMTGDSKYAYKDSWKAKSQIKQAGAIAAITGSAGAVRSASGITKDAVSYGLEKTLKPATEKMKSVINAENLKEDEQIQKEQSSGINYMDLFNPNSKQSKDINQNVKDGNIKDFNSSIQDIRNIQNFLQDKDKSAHLTDEQRQEYINTVNVSKQFWVDNLVDEYNEVTSQLEKEPDNQELQQRKDVIESYMESNEYSFLSTPYETNNQKVSDIDSTSILMENSNNGIDNSSEEHNMSSGLTGKVFKAITFSNVRKIANNSSKSGKEKFKTFSGFIRTIANLKSKHNKIDLKSIQGISLTKEDYNDLSSNEKLQYHKSVVDSSKKLITFLKGNGNTGFLSRVQLAFDLYKNELSNPDNSSNTSVGIINLMKENLDKIDNLTSKLDKDIKSNKLDTHSLNTQLRQLKTLTEKFFTKDESISNKNKGDKFGLFQYFAEALNIDSNDKANKNKLLVHLTKFINSQEKKKKGLQNTYNDLVNEGYGLNGNYTFKEPVKVLLGANKYGQEEYLLQGDNKTPVEFKDIRALKNYLDQVNQEDSFLDSAIKLKDMLKNDSIDLEKIKSNTNSQSKQETKSESKSEPKKQESKKVEEPEVKEEPKVEKEEKIEEKIKKKSEENFKDKGETVSTENEKDIETISLSETKLKPLSELTNTSEESTENISEDNNNGILLNNDDIKKVPFTKNLFNSFKSFFNGFSNKENMLNKVLKHSTNKNNISTQEVINTIDKLISLDSISKENIQDISMVMCNLNNELNQKDVTELLNSFNDNGFKNFTEDFKNYLKEVKEIHNNISENFFSIWYTEKGPNNKRIKTEHNNAWSNFNITVDNNQKLILPIEVKWAVTKTIIESLLILNQLQFNANHSRSLIEDFAVKNPSAVLIDSSMNRSGFVYNNSTYTAIENSSALHLIPKRVNAHKFINIGLMDKDVVDLFGTNFIKHLGYELKENANHSVKQGVINSFGLEMINYLIQTGVMFRQELHIQPNLSKKSTIVNIYYGVNTPKYIGFTQTKENPLKIIQDELQFDNKSSKSNVKQFVTNNKSPLLNVFNLVHLNNSNKLIHKFIYKNDSQKSMETFGYSFVPANTKYSANYIEVDDKLSAGKKNKSKKELVNNLSNINHSRNDKMNKVITNNEDFIKESMGYVSNEEIAKSIPSVQEASKGKNIQIDSSIQAVKDLNNEYDTALENLPENEKQSLALRFSYRIIETGRAVQNYIHGTTSDKLIRQLWQPRNDKVDTTKAVSDGVYYSSEIKLNPKKDGKPRNILDLFDNLTKENKGVLLGLSQALGVKVEKAIFNLPIFIETTNAEDNNLNLLVPKKTVKEELTKIFEKNDWLNKVAELLYKETTSDLTEKERLELKSYAKNVNELAGNESPQLINALIDLGTYMFSDESIMTVQSFVEIDGMANGLANIIRQFSTQFTPEFIKAVRASGVADAMLLIDIAEKIIQNNNKDSDINITDEIIKLMTDKDFEQNLDGSGIIFNFPISTDENGQPVYVDDLYETVANNMNNTFILLFNVVNNPKILTVQDHNQLINIFGENKNYSDILDNISNIMRLFKNNPNIDADIKFDRSFSKKGTTPVTYGGKLSGVVKQLYSDISKEIRNNLNRIYQQNQISTDDVAYIKLLNNVLGNRVIVKLNTSQEIKDTIISLDNQININNLERTLKNGVGVLLHETIVDTYPAIKTMRNAIALDTDSINLFWAELCTKYFNALDKRNYDKGYKKVETKDTEDGFVWVDNDGEFAPEAYTPLSKKEYTNIAKTIINVPFMGTAHNIDDSALLITELFDNAHSFLKENVFNRYSIIEQLHNNPAYVETVSNDSKLVFRNRTPLYTQLRHRLLEGIKQIANAEASNFTSGVTPIETQSTRIMTNTTVKEYGLGNTYTYDGISSEIGQRDINADLLNKGFHETHSNFNVLEQFYFRMFRGALGLVRNSSEINYSNFIKKLNINSEIGLTKEEFVLLSFIFRDRTNVSELMNNSLERELLNNIMKGKLVTFKDFINFKKYDLSNKEKSNKYNYDFLQEIVNINNDYNNLKNNYKTSEVGQKVKNGKTLSKAEDEIKQGFIDKGNDIKEVLRNTLINKSNELIQKEIDNLYIDTTNSISTQIIMDLIPTYTNQFAGANKGYLANMSSEMIKDILEQIKYKGKNSSFDLDTDLTKLVKIVMDSKEYKERYQNRINSLPVLIVGHTPIALKQSNIEKDTGFVTVANTPKEIEDYINNIIDNFKKLKSNKLSQSQKVKLLLLKKLLQSKKIKSLNGIKINTEIGGITGGQYSPKDHSITLSLDTFNNIDTLLETLTHELIHAATIELIDNVANKVINKESISNTDTGAKVVKNLYNLMHKFAEQIKDDIYANEILNNIGNNITGYDLVNNDKVIQDLRSKGIAHSPQSLLYAAIIKTCEERNIEDKYDVLAEFITYTTTKDSIFDTSLFMVTNIEDKPKIIDKLKALLDFAKKIILEYLFGKEYSKYSNSIGINIVTNTSQLIEESDNYNDSEVDNNNTSYKNYYSIKTTTNSNSSNNLSTHDKYLESLLNSVNNSLVKPITGSNGYTKQVITNKPLTNKTQQFIDGLRNNGLVINDFEAGMFDVITTLLSAINLEKDSQYAKQLNVMVKKVNNDLLNNPNIPDNLKDQLFNKTSGKSNPFNLFILSNVSKELQSLLNDETKQLFNKDTFIGKIFSNMSKIPTSSILLNSVISAKQELDRKRKNIINNIAREEQKIKDRLSLAKVIKQNTTDKVDIPGLSGLSKATGAILSEIYVGLNNSPMDATTNSVVGEFLSTLQEYWNIKNKQKSNKAYALGSAIIRWFLQARESTQYIYQMKNEFGKYLGDVREKLQIAYPTLIMESFNGNFTDDDNKVVHNAVIKTQLDSFLNDNTGDLNNTIADIIINNKKRDDYINKLHSDIKNEITNILKKHKITSVSADEILNYYIWQSKGLGDLMVNRQAKGRNSKGSHHILSNANAIASLTSHPKFFAFAQNTYVNQINAEDGFFWDIMNSNIPKSIRQLSTIHSFNNVSSADRQALSDMIKNRFDGINTLVQSMNNLRNQDKNFKLLGTDGSIFKTNSDPYVSIKVVHKSEDTTINKLKRYGYIQETTLQDGDYVVLVDKQHIQQSYTQGVFNLFNEKINGADRYTGENINSTVSKKLDETQVKPINQEFVNAVTNASTDPNYYDKLEVTSNMKPVHNTTGAIIGYSVELGSALRDSLKEPEDIGIYSLGNYDANEMEIQMGIELAKKNIDTLNKAYENDKQKGKYIKLDSKSYLKYSNQKLGMRVKSFYEALPISTQRYIDEIGGLYLNINELSNIIGYEDISIIDLFKDDADLPKPIKSLIQKTVNIFYNKGMNPIKWMKIGETLLKESVSFGKDIILNRSFVVGAGNIASNVIHLVNVTGLSNAKNIPKDMEEGLYFVKKYENEQTKLYQIERKLKNTQDSIVKKKLLREKDILEHSINTNPAILLINDGMVTSFNAETGFELKNSSKGQKLGSKFVRQGMNKLHLTNSVNKISDSKIGTIGKEILITEDSKIHNFLNQVLDYGDFTSKYALFKYLTKQKGVSNEKALHICRDEFVNYSMNRGSLFDYANVMGITWFMSYATSIQKVIWRRLRTNTLGTLATYGATEYLHNNRLDTPLGLAQSVPQQNIFDKRWSYTFNPTNVLSAPESHYLIKLFKWMF